MLPVTFTVKPNEQAWLEEHRGWCEGIGVRLREVGPGRLLLQSVPSLPGELDNEAFIFEFLRVAVGTDPDDSILPKLARAWLPLLKRSMEPLSDAQLVQLLRIEEKKRDGYRGFYRYRITTVLSHDEIVHRTQPEI